MDSGRGDLRDRILDVGTGLEDRLGIFQQEEREQDELDGVRNKLGDGARE